jgi:ubiquinone/menaquinone biosynthesis C-methylase UbiE
MRQMSPEEFKAVDPLTINKGKNPYHEGHQAIFSEFRRGPNFYRNYVQKRTKFTGGGTVLDLMCGFGMWSMFLAEVNGEVIGIDKAPGCKPYAEALAKFFEIDNTKFMTGLASETQRFADASFDYVWIYSALQYVHRGETLTEMHRILKPGGRLFVGNYNSTGLMINHFMDGVKAKTINKQFSQWALNALVHGPLWDGLPNFATPETIAEICGRYGLKVIVATPQGGLNLSAPDGRVPDFEPAKVYDHYDTVMEFVAEKI